MAIFKVCRHDKLTEKKLVRAMTIEELLNAAKAKLMLTDDKYKIFTEDYCEIDDNDILMDLAQNSKENLLLTIVPDGTPWISGMSTSLSSGSTVTTLPTQASTSTNQGIELYTPSSTQESTSLRQIRNSSSQIYKKCNTNVQRELRKGKFLGYNAKKNLVHVIASYMAEDLDDVSLGTAKALCSQIIEDYPDSFKVSIGNQNLKGAALSLGMQVYTRINFTKKRDKTDDTPSRSRNVEDLDESSSIAPKARDEYGCVAYLPNLTSSETWESQEQKRLQLIEDHNSGTALNDDILKSMTNTYCLQRKSIHDNKDITTFFNDWPYFKCPKVIIAHANELLGKDTVNVWKENLNELYKPIICLARDNEIVASTKYRKKNKNADLPEELRDVRKQIKEAKEFSVTLQNEEPYHNIVFNSIVKCLGIKEDIEYLYSIIEEETEDEQLLQAAQYLNPILIIRGNNIHSSSSMYDVVIEKKISIRMGSFLEGILITFLCYYIFAFVYPPKIEATLETIQRLLFKIDPEKGTKRGGKRKATIQHPKLTKFIEQLHQYNEDNEI